MLRILTPKRDERGRIKPQTQLTIEAIREKIAEDEAEIAAAETELRAKALDASLIDDPHPAAGQLQRLREARDRLEVHRHALAAAEEAERDRLAAAQTAADKSRRRALAQHVASIERDGRAYEMAITNAYAAFRRMLATADTAKRLLRPEEADFATRLSLKWLREACEQEHNRQGLNHPLSDEPNCPGTRPGATFAEPDATPALGDRLKQVFASYMAWLNDPVPEAKPARAEIPPVASTQEPTVSPANVYVDIVTERESAIAEAMAPAGSDVIHDPTPLDFTGASEPARLTLTEVADG